MSNNNDSPRRRTRKEFLLTRKQQDQYRQIRLAVIGLVGFLVLVLGSGLVYEYIVKPNQPVAEVRGTRITLAEWQQRVRFERAQAIDSIDSLYNLLGGDVNQLTQFAGQQLQLLLAPDLLGETVLNQMIDEELVRQEAATLGVAPSDAEIDRAIEERFNYFGGGLPTPTTSPTETPQPTPSVTPIGFELTPTAAPTEAPDGEPTPEPTALPTATPVSAEGFEELFNEELARVGEFGLDEAGYRALTRYQLSVEKLADAFGEDATLTTEEERVSLFYMSFGTEEEARAVQATLTAGEKDYLTAWNEIRSTERISATQPFASEFQWTATSGISNTLGSTAADLVLTLPLDTPSDVLATPNGRFVILNLRGREMQPLAEQAIDQQKQQLVNDWLDDVRGDVVIYPRWEANVPDRPILDPKYYTQQAAPTTEAPVEIVTPIPATPAP